MVSSLVRAQSAYAHFMMHAPTHPHMRVLMHALMHAHMHTPMYARMHTHRRWWG